MSSGLLQFPAVRSDQRTHAASTIYEDTCSGVHFMSPGLVQLPVVRSDQRTHAASTVGVECCGKADHRLTGAKRREHITPILRQLDWLPVRRRVEFKMASLVSAVKQSTCVLSVIPASILNVSSPLMGNLIASSLVVLKPANH